MLGGLAVAAHRVHDRHGEGRDEPGDHDPEGEREPQRLRAEPAGDRLLAGASRPRDLRGRPVLEEVEDPEQPREHRRGDPERGELGAAEVADDRRVDEDVERLGRERPQRRHGEAQDLPVVP